MTPELIGIVSVGVALLVGLGGLNLTIAAWLRSDIGSLRSDIGSLRTEVQGLDRRVSRIEGRLGESGS